MITNGKYATGTRFHRVVGKIACLDVDRGASEGEGQL